MATKNVSSPSSSNNNNKKKKRPAGEISTSVDCDGSRGKGGGGGKAASMLMEQGGSIVNPALACLDPKDLARATQVCKQWEKEIDQYTWKQSAINFNPEACQALERAMGRKTPGAQALAAGLTKIQTIAPNRELPLEPEPTFPEPTLKTEDLYYLVELEAFGQKRAWCKSLDGAVKASFESGRKIQIDFNEDGNQPHPTEFEIPANLRDQIQVSGQAGPVSEDDDAAGIFIFENIRLSLSLWRVDTGQTCCICQQHELDDNDFEGVYDSCFSVFNYFLSGGISPVGKVATTLCRYYGYECFQCDVKVYLHPVLPLPGSNEEPEWLKVAREEESYSWEMVEYLAKGDTKYRLCGVHLEMEFALGRDDYDLPAWGNVRCARDFLLFMEGLDWQ